jgi:hypothetical protein
MQLMKKTLRTTIIAIAGLLMSTPFVSKSAATTESPQPVVELAVLLDTSNSMDGLIEQAKGQLWKIVNEFIKAKQNGRAPEVRVALFEYGKSTLPASEGYIRLIQPLTNDLDRISEDLFALKTSGGEEYCGWVIREAVERLGWSTGSDVYRAIFIAGNEPFTQGSVDYAASCKAAVAKGIIVNTIHCGGEAEGRNTKWQDGALLADGKFMTIDHSSAVVHFEAPQDKEIAKLGEELNKTYIAYGAEGKQSAARQAAQDANSAMLGAAGAPVNRAVTKASANYLNYNWDLVDAVKADSSKLEELKDADLPAEMRKMTEKERKDYVEAKARERAGLQQRIQALNEERNKYVAEKAKATAVTNTLDAVMITTLREQAAKKNYQFE